MSLVVLLSYCVTKASGRLTLPSPTGRDARESLSAPKTESVKEGSDLSEKPEGLEMTVMTLNLVEKQPAAMRRIIGKHLAVLAGRIHVIIIIR